MSAGRIADLDPTMTAGLQALVAAGRAERLSELVQLYLRHSTSLIEKLRAALANDDAVAAFSAAHNLRTGSATFGALQLARLCREIERLAQAKALPPDFDMQAVVDEHAAVSRAVLLLSARG